MVRFGLALVTLLVAAAVAAAGTLIVLPPFGWVDWTLRTAATEFSLILLLPILLALLLAWFSGWARMPRIGLVAAILAALAIPLALLPAVRGGIEAYDRGIGIDPWEYLSGTGLDIALGSDETVTYGPAGPAESGRQADSGAADRELVVWRPDRESDPGRQLPAVINVHDGSGFDRWNRWFTDRGMIAFELVMDSSDGSSGSELRPDEVKCAADWVSANATELGVDPDRIMLFGTGTGGQLVMLAGYADGAELPSACPRPDHSVEPGAAGDETGFAAVLTLYPRSEHPDRAAEPFRYLDRHDPPTLLAHGGRDPVIPAAQSRRTAAELDVAGVPGRLVEIDYAGHGFDLNWGGFAGQISRAEIERFLDARVR